ncbi:hypothetical protein CEP53_004859 [Fusarium sp. AF-6]|nr:hypothetical protein CEP53_004859 [Fusarium sp. AF-6]
MSSKFIDDQQKVDMEKGENDTGSYRVASNTTYGAQQQDVLGAEDVNPVLMAKMHLVNDAIDEIGWTSFHLKLFCLSGFGYAVDSLVAVLQGIVAAQAYAEIGHGGYPTGLTMALYAGLLVGALFWGFGADMVGRKIAFNTTLFITSIATIISGAATHWAFFGTFIALLGFGAGGNLVLDPTVFLEFLPSKKQWLVTAMATWWGFGQASAGFIAWGYFSRKDFSCDPADPDSCTWQNNKAWRLIMFTSGGIIFIMSIVRVMVIELTETPKHLLAAGKDEQLVEELQSLAAKHNRPCSLTVAQLQSLGPVETERTHHGVGEFARELGSHLRGLFVTRKIAISTTLIWFSWTLIGLAYPLFFIFLPALISNRVPNQNPSLNTTWRDYTITSLCASIGPLIACVLAEVKFLGRKHTMGIGAVVTAAFFFGYTAVKTSAQNLVLSCCISVCINVYYGTLYAYTAEVLPSAHRTTGNGISVALNRVMGLLSAVIAQVADTTTVTPLYICAGLFIVLMIVSALLPFEPRGRRAS